MCSSVSKPNWKPPFILLVDRGGCTFVQKARNAQHTGATAVIIADSKCQCKHEKVCTPEAYESDCELDEPIMADDGSGGDITIPTILLFKQDADPIKSYLESNGEVKMELIWSSMILDEHVEWDLWTSPTDDISANFKSEFKAAVQAFGESASMTPHMHIYDGLASGCRQKSTQKSVCFNLCTNEGRYCAPNPPENMDLYYGISGADIVTESLRRLCIWKLYGDDGVGIHWWNYIESFSKLCDTSEDFMTDECVQRAMTEADVEWDAVEQCIYDSGGLKEPGMNSLLQLQVKEQEKYGIVIVPAVYVNGVAVRGQLEFANIFNAICSGYAPGTEPDICNRCARCDGVKKCVSESSLAVVPAVKTTEPGTVPPLEDISLKIAEAIKTGADAADEAETADAADEVEEADIADGPESSSEEQQHQQKQKQQPQHSVEYSVLVGCLVVVIVAFICMSAIFYVKQRRMEQCINEMRKEYKDSDQEQQHLSSTNENGVFL